MIFVDSALGIRRARTGPTTEKTRSRMATNSFYGNNSRLATGLYFLSDLLWWLLLGPLAYILPRQRNLVLIFGRDGGKFVDNCKHLFAACVEREDEHREFVYVCKDVALATELKRPRGRGILYGSLTEFLCWLRAGTIFVDSVDWPRSYRFAASRGGRVVQMWHGIPLKEIQLARIRRRPRKRFPLHLAYAVQLHITGRSSEFDWLLSTSPYVTERAFRHSFNYARVSEAGYPRNDALFASRGSLAEIGVDESARTRVAQFRADHRAGKVCLYAPTFRDDLKDFTGDGRIDIRKLSVAAQELELLILIKLHPWVAINPETASLPGIVFVTSDSDVYPILREVDILVTDYSSIFFDFLLLDRPIVFFPFDLGTYLAKERSMYFDYDAMTPGPKAYNINSLIDNLGRLAQGSDPWAEDRKKIRDLVFLHADGSAAERLLNDLF